MINSNVSHNDSSKEFKASSSQISSIPLDFSEVSAPVAEIHKSKECNYLLETLVEANYKFTAEFDPCASKFTSKKLLNNLNEEKENLYEPLSNDSNRYEEEPKCGLQQRTSLFRQKHKSIKVPLSATTNSDLQSSEDEYLKNDNFNVRDNTGNNITAKSFRCFLDQPSQQLPSLSIMKEERNPDLGYISSDTLISLMNNKDFVDLVLIDCRYQYEYNGGHINLALNITTPQLLEDTFFSPNIIEAKESAHQFTCVQNDQSTRGADASNLRTKIIIFYCEFSQKRAPRALRTLRNLDRARNQWPNLHYPHSYILKDGYKSFFSKFPEMCTEQNSYVEMLDIQFKEQYRSAKQHEQMVWRTKKSFDITKLESLTLQDYEENGSF